MSIYSKNREVMAYSLAQMLAPLVPLHDEESLYLSDIPDAVQTKIAEKMAAEYYNTVDIDPLMVRTLGLADAYKRTLLKEFEDSLMSDCEGWMARIVKEDRAA